MLISNIDVVPQRDHCELRAQVSFETHWVWGDKPFDLWFRFPAQCRQFLSADNGDPFVAAFLAPAMVLGEGLQLSAPVSARLAKSIPTIQSVFHCWDEKLAKVAVVAPTREQSAVTAGDSGATGLFYSLGVDSSYALFKNFENHPNDEETITHLIVVEGYDVYLWESYRFPPMLERMTRVAAQYGKTVLPVTTNLREVTDRIADWVMVYHGAALATVALALGSMFSRVHISASQTYARLIPRGAHPCLDPLWGTETLTFVHDGLEARRIDKIRYIARSPIIVENLRVCATDEVTAAYNCGRCVKCLETMIGLHIAGVLDQSQTFPHEIDIEAVRQLSVSNRVILDQLKELLSDLGTSERDSVIRGALTDCIERNERNATQ
jgi:hypothetical protein